MVMIQLKGRQAGALRCIIPAEMSEEEASAAFEKLLSASGRLMQGRSIEIDLGTRAFDPSFILEIWNKLIKPSGCAVSRWIAADDESRGMMGRIGFNISSNEDADTKSSRLHEQECKAGGAEGLVCFGSVGSGQIIRHDGDIVVIGNVEKDAEISAEGNITVTGRISGLVHAGCGGNDGAAVTGRSLETGQVRIGTKLGIIDRASPFWGKAVALTVIDGEVQAVPWPEL